MIAAVPMIAMIRTISWLAFGWSVTGEPEPLLVEDTKTETETTDGEVAELEPPPAAPAANITVSEALSRLPTEPSIHRAQEAALRRAAVSPRTIRRWLQRSRSAAVLPEVSVQMDVDRDQGWDLDREAGSADRLKTKLSGAAAMRLRFSWELDRLIFAADELRAVRAGLDLLEWRDRLMVEVTRLYFERLRLLLERELARGQGNQVLSAAALERETRLLEVEAILEGLTGLQFGVRPTTTAGGRTRASETPRAGPRRR